MKCSRLSHSYVPVPKLRNKTAKKQHDNEEIHEYNVVEDTLKRDDIAEVPESDNIADKTSESGDVAEDASERDDVAEEASERDDVAEDTSERSSERRNEVCMNAKLSRISLNGYEN